MILVVVLSGLVKLTIRILKVTLCLEGLGAIGYAFVFIPAYGIQGIWFSIFHACEIVAKPAVRSVTDWNREAISLCGMLMAPSVSGLSYSNNSVRMAPVTTKNKVTITLLIASMFANIKGKNNVIVMKL